MIAFIPRVCRNQFEFVVNESLHVILSEFSKYIWIDTALDKNAVVDDDLYFNVASTFGCAASASCPSVDRE